jgi:hypothetical protein
MKREVEEGFSGVALVAHGGEVVFLRAIDADSNKVRFEHFSTLMKKNSAPKPSHSAERSDRSGN